MAKKKKEKKKQQQTLSPENLIKSKGRSLPIYECRISEDISKCGLGHAVIARQHKGGAISVANYLIDIYCCGVKSSFYEVRLDTFEYNELISTYETKKIFKVPYEVVHNWIYGAIAWANEAGISPHKSFSVTQYMLEEDTEDIPLIEYEFGCNGKHRLCCSSKIEANKYLKMMQKKLTEDEYDIEVPDMSDDYDDSPLSFSPNFVTLPNVKYDYKGIEYPETLDIENPELLDIISKEGSEITKEDLKKIDEIPYNSLSNDLHNILLYDIGILRKNLENEDERMYKIGWQVSNALILMGKYGNPQTNLLDLYEAMRQDEDFFDFVIGDCPNIIIEPTLTLLAKDNLISIKNYLLEPNLWTYFKIEAIIALGIVGTIYASKRDEVLSIAGEILDIYTEAIEENIICDGTIAAFLVSIFIDLQAKEFLPKIKKLYETNLVDETLDGNYNKVETLMNKKSNALYDNLKFDTYERFKEFRKFQSY